MPESKLRIDVPNTCTVTAVRHEPSGRRSGYTFIYAPGAGSNIHDPFGVYACRQLAKLGFACVRLQFPYMEASRRSPDRTSVLEATWRAAIGAVRAPRQRLVVGGRSMGGRIASQVVAQGEPVDAVALFAYPLHPPGKPQQRRDEHLPAIDVPVLFCSGTRDSFATPDELSEVAARMRHARVCVLDEADHGFGVRKSSGRTRYNVWDEASDSLRAWLREEVDA